MKKSKGCKPIMNRGELQKNAFEKIIVQKEPYKGHEYIDVRVHYRDVDGEYKPSRKGIAIPLKHVEEIISLIKKAYEDAEST